VVADGGSPPDFVGAISSLPHISVVIPQQPGLVGQVQAAFAAARVLAPFILYLESDKALFAQHTSTVQQNIEGLRLSLTEPL